MNKLKLIQTSKVFEIKNLYDGFENHTKTFKKGYSFNVQYLEVPDIAISGFARL